eukprot:9941156-Alexandrium_andersonii.AAC.1
MLVAGVKMVGLEEWSCERLVPRACLRAWYTFVDALVLEIEAAVGEDLREWGVAELEQLQPVCRAAGLGAPIAHLGLRRRRRSPAEHLEAVRGDQLREAGVAAGSARAA